MFRSLRWRLTFWFVLLTAAVYALSAMYSLYMFREGLTNLIEDELEALMSEIEPAITWTDGHPTLHEWAQSSLSVPFKYLPTIQLFDNDGKMIERYGPHGILKLYKTEQEVRMSGHAVLVSAMPLLRRNKQYGYVQIQLNLRNRDRAVNTFINTITGVSPYLLISLAIAGYVFSAMAARPIEQGYDVLRRFMNDAGHELGTPISIIQANAESMEPDVHDMESVNSKLSIIVRSTERLTNLVQDLSLLSKMESPQVTQRKAILELDKLVKSVTEDCVTLFGSKNIQLEIGNLAPATVYGDNESLKRMLMNLLQNALRYTEAGGKTTVSLDHLGRQARLVVADTGIGIPEQSLPKIFDRFYRVEESRSRAAGGSGLGLSIVKAVVDLHRGKIEVSSKLGVGTTFTILLPSRSPAHQPQA